MEQQLFLAGTMENSPHSIFVHCHCHLLQLACVQAAKNTQGIKHVYTTLTTLWKYFHYSPKWAECLKEIQWVLEMLEFKIVKSSKSYLRVVLGWRMLTKWFLGVHSIKNFCQKKWAIPTIMVYDVYCNVNIYLIANLLHSAIDLWLFLQENQCVNCVNVW